MVNGFKVPLDPNTVFCDYARRRELTKHSDEMRPESNPGARLPVAQGGRRNPFVAL